MRIVNIIAFHAVLGHYSIPTMKWKLEFCTDHFFIKQCNNKFLFFQIRDLSVAFCLVALTYTLVGVLFFISFPREKSCIQQVLSHWYCANTCFHTIVRLPFVFKTSCCSISKCKFVPARCINGHSSQKRTNLPSRLPQQTFKN